MKKLEQCFKNNKRGITLIALVITIVVLLILASVSIATLTGDNGILKQATRAKEETEKAKTNEQTDLVKMEDLINESVNGSEVEQVTDTAPGVLERNDTETNTYTINSIEDLVFFSYDVNNNRNTYEGQTIKLGLSLDFDSSKSYVDAYRTDYGKYGYNGVLKTLLTSGEGFKPIGTYLNNNTSINDETNTPFMGTFDGNNHEINGLRIVSSEKGKGLFGLVKGATIKNLGIGNDSTIKVNLVSGSIVGYANEGTTIENCYNNATILESTENSQQLGGIAGQLTSSSNITNCFNLANISGGSNLGGIAGMSSGNIDSCYNTGVLTGEERGVGGIAGMSSGNIDSCYNTGVLTGEERVGGIAGQQYNNDNAKISNSYNVGKINNADMGSGIIGALVTGKLENNFYLENIVNGGNGTPFDGSTAKTMEEMKNIYTSLGNAFKADSNNINNGYPILSWQ